ncbi:MAG: CrcB family protein [Bacteroidetes bacterium]|nr:CrcB family protein [Bacteroidota bacterium]MBU1579284.1 CrcB family protein [Bacteroidota bacterium]MBU2556468.1 CrcB family protein [Bacteroidota bacterium]
MQQLGNQLILLAAGGSIGTILRFFVYQLADKFLNKHLPWGTLLVNLAGSLAIGFLWGFLDRSAVTPAIRLFLFIGILGSFTTFSTFAFDSFYLMHQGEFKLLIFNLLLNNVLGILFCGGAYYLVKFLI